MKLAVERIIASRTLQPPDDTRHCSGKVIVWNAECAGMWRVEGGVIVSACKGLKAIVVIVVRDLVVC